METNVIHLPALTPKPMTARDFREWKNDFAAEHISSNAKIKVEQDSYFHAKDDPPLRITIQPTGNYGFEFIIYAEDWDEACQNIERFWTVKKLEIDGRNIRDMALAIIKVVDDQGACTDSALRMEGFTQEQVIALGDLACARAAVMAGRQPFEIVRSGTPNAAA